MAPRSDLSLQEKSPAKAQSIQGKGTYILHTRLVLVLQCPAFVSPPRIKRILVEIKI